jgi:hypothetical protein
MRGKTSASPANYNISEAIRKIKMRQLYNGAITLWDGKELNIGGPLIFRAFLIGSAESRF